MATVFEQAINNGTVLVRDFIKSTQQNDVAGLYAGVNPAQLNWLELAWMNWYSWVGNTTLATGIMSFVMHEVVYFGRCLPWMIIDYMGWFKQYKLQADKVPSAKQQWECTKEVLKTHFSVELPQIYLFHPMAVAVGMKTWEVPFPSFFGQIVPQVMLFFFMEDFWHYTVHRIMHHRALYKHVHKVHHTYSAPFGLAAEYAHPIEVLVLGLGTVGGPLLWCYLSGGNMHLITMYTWICCRLFQAVDAHSGYDFPWSLNHWLPIWAGAEHHDYHHEKFNECFSSSLRVWDWLLGTDQKYHAYRKAQAEAKTAKKAQ
ncbi:Fatty acid hydroxylase superfamily-domain containing protein [Rhodotorula toruloides]|uniref:BY PROTMAP: gi/472583032/gb/EMS20694.1/ C-4 methylsterol oxidase [Rhodosporidium toruloides NP11] gi/647396633/emb/CDR39072.1/ RHTO0S04e00650g1_1 [Rhodosporidium toruloides] n=1 Tax=Rhodotorula toruloides TaxID=5286 RepID=A0A0K3CJL0_RHOTO|nr:Fatty acid hydroxylase superfamily-domain containing protein [Rhodotorula toruloides]